MKTANKFMFTLFLILGISKMSFSQENYTQYVNPLVGTKNMGHTFPGASTPFGMVQLSPETNNQPYEKNGRYNPEVYKYCAGYQYEDTTIFGFSHTHFNGTGHSDLGDFLIMPTTGVLELSPGEAGKNNGYHSSFSHENETASPGYYKVELDKYKIKAELTTSDRVGFHQYTFPKSENARIILDLVANIYNYEGKNVWTEVRVENDTLVTGYRQTQGWARNKKVYFAMVFSKPIKEYGHKKYDNTFYKGFWRRFNESENFPEMSGHDIRAYFNFDTNEGEQLKMKFALSSVSTDGALKNLKAEIPHWDFEKTKRASEKKWNTELQKVKVNTLTSDDKQTFYTALYHTMLGPTTYMDVDGAYRGLDKKTHYAKGFTHYTTFSLWDTYRALHPWFNIYQPKRNQDMIKSMLAHYDQSVHHILPIWSHYSNENWCMIGYHSVSVIADAIAKGNVNFDVNKALNAAVKSATFEKYDGLDHYTQLGYVAEDLDGASVSKTLEYSYDDWCIAQMANALGKKDIYNTFMERSQYFNNVYDASSGFMRPKLSNGKFKKKFDPLSTHGQGFIEGNAWNYSLYVPHDVPQMVKLNGGKKKFSAYLDTLFTMELDDKHFAGTEDITRDGIIGNYVHGNEPSHHVVYLYNWTDKPWMTQKRVRMIMNEMYGNTIDGLSGNDDAGQMSAWYIFSSLGFYPVAPGSDWYSLGSPSVKNAELTLENGKTLRIETKNQSEKNVFVKYVLVNGKKIDRNYIKHNELINGGTITFIMSSRPNKKAKLKVPQD